MLIFKPWNFVFDKLCCARNTKKKYTNATHSQPLDPTPVARVGRFLLEVISYTVGKISFQTARKTGGHVRKRLDQTFQIGKSGLHTGGDRGNVGVGQSDESIYRHRNEHLGHKEDILHGDRCNGNSCISVPLKFI